MKKPKTYSYKNGNGRRFTFPRDLGNLSRVVTNAGSHFFDEKTMRFFRSEVDPRVYVNEREESAYFVTSEKGPDGVRRYTVRKWSAKAPSYVETVGDFGGFGRLASALRRAKALGVTP